MDKLSRRFFLAGLGAVVAAGSVQAAPASVLQTAPTGAARDAVAELREWLFPDEAAMRGFKTLYAVRHGGADAEMVGWALRREQEQMKGLLVYWAQEAMPNLKSMPEDRLIARARKDDAFLGVVLERIGAHFARDKRQMQNFKTRLSPADGTELFIEQIKECAPYRLHMQARVDGLTEANAVSTIDAHALQAYRTLPPEQTASVMMVRPAQAENGLAARERETLPAWDQLRQTLEALGAQVTVLDPAEHKTRRTSDVDERAQDRQMYVRDEMLFCPKLKIAFAPVDADGAKTARYHAMAQEAGFRIVKLEGYIDGGNFMVNDRHRLMFVPDADMPSARDIATMERETGHRAIRVAQMRPKEFYHLDTFMAALPGGEIMVYPRAMAEQSFKDIMDAVGRDNMIVLDRKDGTALAANTLAVGDTLVMPGASAGLQRDLQARGYKVVTPQAIAPEGVSFYQTTLGSVRCMTQELYRPQKTAPAVTPAPQSNSLRPQRPKA